LERIPILPWPKAAPDHFDHSPLPRLPVNAQVVESRVSSPEERRVPSTAPERSAVIHDRSRSVQLIREASVGKQDLSPGGRIAIGIALTAMGLAIVVLGVGYLVQDPRKLASGEVAALPVGVVFAAGGAMLALPERFVRTRALVGALLITAFALTFDWIAFGPGERQFRGGISSGPVVVHMNPGETPGRVVFGIGAVMMDLVAVLVWVRLLRKLFGVTNTTADP
jgi:hypothetical protein